MMSEPFDFEFNNEEYSVKDPTDSVSWVEALRTFIDEFAEDHSATRWEPQRDCLSDETLEKIAGVVSFAFAEYRGLTEAERGTRSFSSILQSQLFEAFEPDDNDCYSDAKYSGGDFTRLREEFEDMLASFEGPVEDTDEIWDQVGYAIEDKIMELDDSTIFDWLGEAEIPLTFNPMMSSVDPKALDRESLRLNGDFFERGPCTEIDGMLKLIRLPVDKLLPLLNIDYKDNEGIRAWLDHEVSLDKELPPLLDGDELTGLTNNIGSYYVYPHWIGRIGLNQLAKIDPTQDLKLTAGAIAFLNNVDGSGDYHPLNDDQFVVVKPSQTLEPEVGYTMQKIFDSRPPESNIANCSLIEIQAKIREKREQERLAPLEVEFSL
jgi:hypothetical protein